MAGVAIAMVIGAASSTAPKVASSTRCRRCAARPSRFARRFGRRWAGRTEELERLAIEMYARGLSVRDIEAAFTDASGKSLLSKSAVSQITERLWADYQAFAGRDLAEYRVMYLFIDGIAERLHLGQPREAVLAAWGISESGEKVLLGLSPGNERRHGERAANSCAI